MRLNIEQKKLATMKPTGHALIKGVAGSGKTTVVVNRLAFLLNNYCYENDDKLLLVTYNKTLVNWIKYVYEKIEEDNKQSFSNLFMYNNKIEIKTIDSIIFYYFNLYKSLYDFKYNLITNNYKMYSILSKCIEQMKDLYPDIDILDQKNKKFLLDEIDWIKSCNYMDIEEYQNVLRFGRMSGEDTEKTFKLNRNSITRAAIFELMMLYNDTLKEEGYIDFKDMALLSLKYLKENLHSKYTHILIDESQDLTRTQLEVIKELYYEKPYSSITFAADTAQSIYSHSWLTKRSFNSIGFNMKGKSNILAKNYRTSTEISKAASSLIEQDEAVTNDDNYVQLSFIDKYGQYPVYKHFENEHKEAEYLVNEIKYTLSSNYEYKDIVIMARGKNQLDYLKDYFGKNNIPCSLIQKGSTEFGEDSVKLMTMHSAKGLESKVVIICGLNTGKIPYYSYNNMDKQMQESIERRLLYVGMTRANELLYLTSSGMPSKFIEEINPLYLRIKNSCEFKKYYPLPIENYKFTDRIKDIYSNEEKVRQWVINELIESYNYPEKHIKMELQVNNFSSVGYVDIAVSNYDKGTLKPYIFIETKALYSGINDGLEQLKSYMSNCKTCEYGIVTDGNEIIVIDKNFDVIDDLPKFKETMAPNYIESFKYNAFDNNNTYEFIRDINTPTELMVNSDSEVIEYSTKDLFAVPKYDNISENQFDTLDNYVDDKFYLPKSWFKNSCENGEYFMLKVKGDSMTGAGINNGSYVVVKKQSYADNRKIFVINLNGNAVIKRFVKMGGTVLLMPENDKYEPIQISQEEASILGQVVGVISSDI